jgi:membrane-bound lytic murein transglycosylase MltF
VDFIAYRDPAKPRIDRWRDLINRTAKAAAVPPCALAAIVERESDGDPNAKSTDGGFGLCQITSGVDGRGVFTQTGAAMFDPASNLETAARFFLVPAISACAKLHESFGHRMDAISGDVLFFAFCAYNAGFGAVQHAIGSGVDPDVKTTNRYGAGTLAFYHAALAASHAAVPAAH